ncbi:MAG: NAD(P)-dependent oxidoreductase [Bacteroidota bacterium]|nr:NAD(P)-dependent oxidoreductase [Bacteroidota bacterium]
MDIIFYEAFEEEEKEIKKHLPKNINAEFTWKSIQEYGSKEPPAKIISTRTQSIYPIKWAKKIKGILSRSTGYDHLKEYQKKVSADISYGYLPLYCHRAVAEQALLLWMSLLRKLPQQIKSFSRFHRDGLTGRETEEKTLLVVGVGNIGSEVAKIGHGLGMKVLGVEIDIKHPNEKYVSIDEGIKKADIIVCAMNLTDKNHNYFNFELLMKAKKDAVFVNISRGEISPSLELLKVLNKNHLSGVALDVFDSEKELANVLRNNAKTNNEETLATLKLMKKSNVILTPHNSFNSVEGVKRKSEQSVEQTISFLKTGKFIWSVPGV